VAWGVTIIPLNKQLHPGHVCVLGAMSHTLFHLAFHVHDLTAARAFYHGVLGCMEGRSTDTWVDVDFFGHQLSLHVGEPFATTNTGLVDGIAVPMPHLGAVLPLEEWKAVSERLEANPNVNFVIRPQVRYQGLAGEQWIVFFRDPSGNPIELKGFADLEAVYAT